MLIFTREELYSLLTPQSPPCISILMPTHRHHPGTEQDPIRFRNLLATVLGAVVGYERERGHRNPENGSLP